jgi:NitT/TauT family transport system substrate-binding protein
MKGSVWHQSSRADRSAPWWRAVAVALGLAWSVAACGPGPSSPPAGGAPAAPPPAQSGGAAPAANPGAAAPAAPPPLVQARLAYTTIAAVQAPFWIAFEAGYFREQGLDVPDMNRIEPGATLLAALQNREVEFVAAGGPSLVLGNLQGLETMIFGSTLHTLESIISARPEIRTVDDLRGKIIGVSRLKAISDIAARLAVERYGLRPDVDVFMRGTGGNAESLAAMEAGTAAAASISVPTVFEARKRGYHDLIDVTAMRIPFANGTLGSTRATLNSRPDVAERVLRAVAQATARFKTDREYAAQVIGQYSRFEDPESLFGTVDVYAPVFSTDPYPEPAATQAVLDVEEHPAARTAKPEDVTDFRPAEALRRSGFLDNLPK